jgi:hypothetical protein
VCAQVLGQVKVDKSPLLPDLGARHHASPGPRLQCVRVQAEKSGGFGEVEGAHAGLRYTD